MANFIQNNSCAYVIYVYDCVCIYLNVLFLERDGNEKKIMCFFIHITILTNIKQFVNFCNEILTSDPLKGSTVRCGGSPRCRNCRTASSEGVYIA